MPYKDTSSLQARESSKKATRRYREIHKEEIRKQRSSRPNLDAASLYARKRRQRIRLEILAHYSRGVPKCARCGIEDIDVLCLDHIQGGGCQDRKDTRHWGDKLYNFLKRTGFPEGYQILCANCNQKKYLEERRAAWSET